MGIERLPLDLLACFLLLGPYIFVVLPVATLVPHLFKAYDELKGCRVSSEVYDTVFGYSFVICTVAYFFLARTYGYPSCVLNFIFGFPR